MPSFYEKWLGHAERVAARTAPLVKKWGWEADDCLQHASMVLWQFNPEYVENLSEAAVQSYLFSTIRRSILRAARKNRLTLDAPAEVLAALPARPIQSFAERLDQCLKDHPPSARDAEVYLRSRVLDQEAFGSLLERMKWHHSYGSSVRQIAADWLMYQFEEGRLQ